jgi:uncharacterized YigZ family protein
MKADEYQILAKEGSAETKVKGSRFLAVALLADSTELALEKLQAVRKKEHAATHHCYAYINGTTAELNFKYSDDGEPNGTAGRPIYDQLAGRELTNALIVVTRYYGGTKLGPGGLVRAYSEAAGLALDQSGIEKKYLTTTFETKLSFPLYDRWQLAVSKLGGKLIGSQFTEAVTLKIEIRNSKAAELEKKFIELTSGKGIISRG